jgi:PPOX class probable F420-dependent enzyme
VNTARGRMKAKNLAREPRVALSISDPENPYRYLGIQGRVTEMTEAGGDAHIDKMAKKYLDKDKYPYRAPGEVRVIVKITPDKVHTNG